MVVPVMAGAVPPGGSANVPKPGAPGAPGQPTYAVMPPGISSCLFFILEFSSIGLNLNKYHGNQ